MKAKDFLSIYTSDGLVQTLAERVRTALSGTIHLKNLSGSLDAVVVAAVFRILKTGQLIILHNKEEANYFFSDLQNLLGGESILFFPLSYKKAYQYDEVENANICMRSEVLSQLSDTTNNKIIVTYPEALAEKVVNKRSLLNNVLTIRDKTILDYKKLEYFLHEHNFVQVDFVREAGQFAIRGGIIDLFSFAGNLPYRIERFGDEVDSIRGFDPDSQLSVSTFDKVNVIPNTQARLIQEERHSFLDFILPSTKIWVKDVELIADVLDKNMEKVKDHFDTILEQTGNTKTVLHPEQLFEAAPGFMRKLKTFTKIEFGKRFYLSADNILEMHSSSQMPFNKNIKLLASTLASAPIQGHSNFIAAEMQQQLDHLQNILEDVDVEAKFTPLKFSLREGFIDKHLKISCYTDHQLFERFYQGKKKTHKSKSLTIKDLQTFSPGDFVTHIDHGIGKFAGLEKRVVNGREQEVIRIVFRDNDILYVSIHSLYKISKYTRIGKDPLPPLVSKLGSREWQNRKAKIRKKVKDIAKELIELYAKRKLAPGHAFGTDGVMQAELESSFIYVDTPDQAVATQDVKRDMEAPHPMDRLICGDVGFGKTEVAIRAAFKAVNEGKQVAILVPTTILALQHYHTFRSRLSNFPLTVEYVSRFRSAKTISLINKRVAKGEIDIVIGTHGLANKNLSFKDLGLLIIDEEQKFGVKVKDKLKESRINIDVLTLTATPIPRTLHFSLMSVRDLSIITTPPSNRQPVVTELCTYDERIIRDAIRQELQRNGQVFFVHNRIVDIEQIANVILKLVPDARIGIAHGQMDNARLEKTMVRFIERECDILVSTNIIESGLDIPNANTVIINRAHTFGLSDLHQIRGRVGRTNKKAFCYLLTPPFSTLPSDSRKRLSTLKEFSGLGDGLKVAMRDLEIRGAGNILGGEQTGFINDIGFETYHRILDDAIQKLKENEFKNLFSSELENTVKMSPFAKECVIETDLEVLIPETYVKNTTERLRLYANLSEIKDINTLNHFRDMLKDRFGDLPNPVIQLINSMPIRWIGEALGVEKIALKLGRMKMYFSTEKEGYFNSKAFGHILKFIQANPSRCQLKNKQKKCLLEVDAIPTIDTALTLLNTIPRLH